MAKKKAQRGGARDGAGRKPLDPHGTIQIGAALPIGLVKRLDALAEKLGWNRSEAVREAVGLLLNARRSGGRGTSRL